MERSILPLDTVDRNGPDPSVFGYGYGHSEVELSGGAYMLVICGEDGRWRPASEDQEQQGLVEEPSRLHVLRNTLAHILHE